VNLSKRHVFYIYRQFYHLKILRSAHTVYLFLFFTDPRTTAIIVLYSINSLALRTETECVYCAVRTQSLTTSVVNFVLQKVI